MRAKAPNGAWIVGTADGVDGTAQIIEDSFSWTSKGVMFDYEGQTDVDWDSQRTKEGESQLRLYVDENGDEWEEDRLILSERTILSARSGSTSGRRTATTWPKPITGECDEPSDTRRA